MSECSSKNSLHFSLPELYAQSCDVVARVAFFVLFSLWTGLFTAFEIRCPHLYIPVLRPQPLDFIPIALHISLLLHPTMYITVAKFQVLVQPWV